jgi:hypothetical protein
MGMKLVFDIAYDFMAFQISYRMEAVVNPYLAKEFAKQHSWKIPFVAKCHTLDLWKSIKSISKKSCYTANAYFSWFIMIFEHFFERHDTLFISLIN